MAQVEALRKQYALLNEEMARASTSQFAQGGGPNGRAYKQMATLASSMSTEFRNAALSTGLFEVSQHKVMSQTENYTRLLEKQKLSLRDMVKNQKVLKATYQEQLRLRNMQVGSFYTDKSGNTMADVFVPKNAVKDLDTVRNRLGFIRAMTASASQQMINWGKNTQWAGRQLMVGFTMPIAAFGAAVGIMAFKVDQELTRVIKVYDTMKNSHIDANTQMMSMDRELAQVRVDSFNMARDVAQKYGASITDTLDAEAQLAATGQRGADLLKNTSEAMRIAALGEMDYNKAVNATITAQTVFGLSTKQTTDAFNYMNAVENATSLSLDDFATALPIAAAPVKQMGGDIKTLGILMTAMKSAGIAASQGANAIKSAMTRLIRPSEQIQAEFKAITGHDILAIRDRNQGNIIDTLTDIYNVTKDLSSVDRAQVFSGLFGTHQSTRLTALVNGMGDLATNTGQVGQAAKLAEQSTKTLAALADQEMKRAAESISGRFKRAFEDIKASFAAMGTVFLEFGAYFLGAVSKLIKAFSYFPDFAKKGAAIGAILLAIVGPAVMLSGLFMNLSGTLFKMMGIMIGLGSKFRLVNKENAIASRLADAAAASLSAEAKATQDLAAQMNALNQAMSVTTQKHYREIMGTQVSGILAANAPVRGASPLAIQAQRQAVINQPLPDLSKQPLLYGPGNMNKVADAAEKTDRSMKGVALSGGLFAAAMATSMFSSSETADHIAQWAMMFAIMLPVVQSIRDAMKGMAAAQGASSILGGTFGAIGAKTGGYFSRIGTAFRGGNGILASLGAATTAATGLSVATFGIAAGVAGAAAAFLALKRNADAADDTIENMYHNTDDLAKIIEYTPSEFKTFIGPGGQSQDSDISKIQQFNDAYGDVVDKIRNAKNGQEALNYAMSQGLKVIASGGTPEQARQATILALSAANKTVADLEDNSVVIPIETQLKFDDPKQVASAFGRQVAQIITDEISHGITTRTFAENLKMFPGQLDIPTAPGVFGTAQTGFAAGLSAAPIPGASQAAKLLGFDRGAAGKEQEASARAAGEQLGMQYIQGIGAGMSGKDSYLQLKQALETIDTQIKVANNLGDDNAVAQWNTYRETLISTFLDAAGASDTVRDAFMGSADAAEVFRGVGDVLPATIDGVRVGTKATQKEIDIINNSFNQTTASGYKLGSGFLKLAHEAERTAAKIATIDKALKKIDWQQWSQDIWSSINSDVGDAITAQFTSDMENSMEAVRQAQQDKLDAFDADAEARGREFDMRSKHLEAQHERETNKFEADWQRRMDAVNRAYDQRTNRVNNAIDAEQKAEDIRQRIFDAEQERIQRLAEMANQNIDFNVALNKGMLDEAAKIRNDMEAAAAGNADSDAQDAGSRRSENRIDSLKKTIDKIDKVRDARIKALEKVEEHQRKMMERQQKREDGELARERRHWERMTEVRRSALETQTENVVDAAQAEWDARKASLDKAMAYFLAFIPRNQKELKQHIADTKARYGEFGNTVANMGDRWAGLIKNSMVQHTREAEQKIRSDINWTKAGREIATQLIAGGLGMTFPEFRRWLALGTTRKQNPWKGNNKPGIDKGNTQPGHVPPGTYHEGGRIGYSGGSGRTGFSGGYGNSERRVNAQVGEFMVKKKEASKHSDLLNAINAGKLENTDVGGIGDMGIAGIFNAALTRSTADLMLQGTLNERQRRRAQRRGAGRYGRAKPGEYAGTEFDAAQLRNAATIASVGKKMNMTRRDIIIGLMTAMQESMLRNVDYGDRDSLGLFQQRPSQGWGTPSQVTDPVYASTQFFKHLRGVPGHETMPLTQAAQAVQRSAYPSAYAKWADEARAILSAMRVRGGGGLRQGPGGGHRPVRGGTISQGIHDVSTGFPAIDISVGTGTPVYAVGDGRITVSKDLIGTDGRQSNGGYYSYGRYIQLKTAAGPEALYAHLNQRFAKAGQMVKGGTIIGRSGNTGHSFGSHLHFGVHGASPYKYLNVGGKMLQDGPVFAHRDEITLTKPLSQAFEQGVQNFATGGNSEYNVHVYPSEGMDEEALAKLVIREMKREEGRKAPNRNVGGKK